MPSVLRAPLRCAARLGALAAALALAAGQAGAAGPAAPGSLAEERTGALALTLADAAGAGLENVEVELEPLAGAAPPLAGWEGRAPFAWTDAAGRARLAPVWAGLPLSVVVWTSDGEAWRFERMRDGALVPRDAPGARPIRVPAGGELALSLLRAPAVVLRGRVRGVDGEPPDWGGYVHVAELDPARPRLQPGSRLRAAWEDDGRFELELRAFPGAGRLALTAARSRTPSRGTLGVRVLTPPWTEPERELELAIGAGLALRGRVAGVDAAAGAWTVVAVPSGATRLEAEALLKRERRGRVFGDGAFAIEDLPAGFYDLHVMRYSGQLGQPLQVFERLPAESEVRLELRAEPAARVRVEALSGGVELLSTVVLAGRLERGAAPPAVVPGAPELRFRGLRPWPEELPPAPGEVARVDRAGLRIVYSTHLTDGAALELPATAPGTYVFGVFARGTRGRVFAPTVTPPIALGPGPHVVRIELRATAPLYGRVLRAADDEPGAEALWVEVHDAWGERIPVRRTLREVAPRVPVRADGTFYVREAPVGSLWLWLGAEPELEQERFRMERRVEVRAGERNEVELDPGGR